MDFSLLQTMLCSCKNYLQVERIFILYIYLFFFFFYLFGKVNCINVCMKGAVYSLTPCVRVFTNMR